MKKMVIAGAVVAVFTSFSGVQAFAQAKNFEGYSFGGNIEADSATSSATDGTSGSANSGGVGIQFQYDWALSDKFLLGVGVSADLGNRQAGTYLSGNNVYTNNRFGFNIEPGYAVSRNLVVYGRVSAIAASVEADDASGTAGTQGNSYGLGVRNLYDRNSYWQIGIDSYKLNDVTFGTGTTASLKGNTISFGLGYKY